MSEDPTQRLPRAIVDIDERLSKLEKQFVERGYDTRPIFEKHDQDIQSLRDDWHKFAHP